MGLLSFLFGNNQNLYSYKKMYLGQIIKGNKIVDIGNVYFNNKLLIYFDLMCCKCKRVQRVNDLENTCACGCNNSKNKSTIEYRKNDIRKLLSERREEKQNIDNFWDTKLVPTKIFLSDSKNKKTFIKDFSGRLSAFPNYILYFLKNESLAAMGLYNIKEVNSDFFIGDYVLYSYSEGYIEFKNVYDNYKYEFEPIIYYTYNNKNIEPKYKIINSNEMNELTIIYFEKNRNSFTLYKYINSTLKNKICGITQVLKKDENGFLLEFKSGIKKYYALLDDRLYETEDVGSNKKDILNFKDFNTNIIVDMNKIDYNTRNVLENISKTNNSRYKKIYVSRKENVHNKVLFKYLETNFEMQKISNEFVDDSNEIYIIEINRDDKQSISFLEYLSAIKKADDFKYKIYGININTIVSTLFSDYGFKNKICDLIKNNIIIIEDDIIRNNFINLIYNYYCINDSINKQICEKLKKKYMVDSIGLFFIILYKYGEENVLDVPCFENKIVERSSPSTISVKYICDNIQNKKLYNTLLAKLDTDEIKWKSEFELFKLIKSYFPDAIYQYRDKFLELQSLDVYIPNFKIAFEYQGLQHYEPVEVFGGEKHFLKQQSNDNKKRIICRKNNIELIEWKYNEKIDKITLDKKLYHLKSQLAQNYIFSDIN